jgi:outer membrane protein
MKKFVFVVLFTISLFFSVNTVNAQAKIGYISLNELIVAMPEYKKADTEMADFQRALQEQSQEYQREFSRKDSIFTADSAKWTVAMRDIKRKELRDIYVKLINFNQGMEKSVQQKEQELLGPIQQKAVITVQSVAKENGYAYVLSKEQLIAFPTADDVMPLVAKKLNIKVGSASPPATTPPAGTAPAPKTNN